MQIEKTNPDLNLDRGADCPIECPVSAVAFDEGDPRKPKGNPAMSPKAKLDASRSRPFIGWALIPLAAAFLMSAPFALADDQTGARHAPAETVASDWRQFTIESELALSKMSLAMTAEPTGDVDRDFVAMMMPHHQGAIDIARAELKYGRNEELRRLARDIIVEQEREMLVMRGVAGEATSAESTDAPEAALEHATSGRNGKD
jgi:predicted outer membrane protein